MASDLASASNFLEAPASALALASKSMRGCGFGFGFGFYYIGQGFGFGFGFVSCGFVPMSGKNVPLWMPTTGMFQSNSSKDMMSLCGHDVLDGDTRLSRDVLGKDMMSIMAKT